MNLQKIIKEINEQKIIKCKQRIFKYKILSAIAFGKKHKYYYDKLCRNKTELKYLTEK